MDDIILGLRQSLSPTVCNDLDKYFDFDAEYEIFFDSIEKGELIFFDENDLEFIYDEYYEEYEEYMDEREFFNIVYRRKFIEFNNRRIINSSYSLIANQWIKDENFINLMLKIGFKDFIINITENLNKMKNEILYELEHELSIDDDIVNLI